MSPKYKLIYMNSRGLAETTRVPVLEVDGTVLFESRAIARYVARENGLAGKDNIESAKCDMLVDAYYDLLVCLNKFFMEPNETLKSAMLFSVVNNDVLPFLAYLNPILKKNNDGAGFLVGDKVTWADIAIAYGLNNIDLLCPAHEGPIFQKFPLLKAYVDRILALPNIKAWIEKRPVTED